MTVPDLVRRRLSAQRLLSPMAGSPEDVVSWLGGVQAQEFGPARWALGLRLGTGSLDADVGAAFDEGRILRTHVLRPTWHFVVPEDIRWLLALTAARIRGSMASYDRQLGIDVAVRQQAHRVFERALRRQPNLTRAELSSALEARGIVATGSRLAHLLLHAGLDAVVCSGPRRGKHFTYALLDQRVTSTPALSRDDAFERIVVRFFRSHGPATLRDFTWWCGLRMTDARRVLEALRASSCEADGLRYWWLDSEEAAPSARDEPLAHLLPVYDEYTVAYRDRAVVPHGLAAASAGTERSIVFHHAFLVDGQIAGTWRPVARREGLAIEVHPRRRLRRVDRAALDEAAASVGRFNNTSVTLIVS